MSGSLANRRCGSAKKERLYLQNGVREGKVIDKSTQIE